MADNISAKEYQRLIGAGGPKKKRGKQRRPEQELQINVAAYLDVLCGPNNFWFTHFPGGGYRSKVEAGIFKAMGTKAGPGDILIIAEGGIAHWIELKIKPNGQSGDQEDFEAVMYGLGCNYDIAYSILDVTRILKNWALIK
jgi:hypothetical protein